MSSTAPWINSVFRPSNGMRISPAMITPMIDPKVFTAYTVPTARSPRPESMRSFVITGRVMPAKNVAGTMTSTQIA